MDARVFLALYFVAKIGWSSFLYYLCDKQRRQELPKIVADVYDKERYEQYLLIIARERNLSRMESATKTVVDFVLLLSPFFFGVEALFGPNEYAILFGTFFVIELLYVPITFFFDWWETFHIENDFGLNKYTREGFIGDYASDELLSIVSMTALLGAITFVCKNFEAWVGRFGASAGSIFAAGLLLLLMFAAASLLVFLLRLKVRRAQYHVVDLPEGELRAEIESMLATCKKRVHAITVYDESSKSTSKNAMVIRLPWYREITIADNYINENDRGELIAVVAHEVGHLKHQNHGFDWTVRSLPLIVMLFFICVAVAWPEPLINMNSWIRASFGLSCSSFYLDYLIFGAISYPVALILNALSNWYERKLEYEADQEAVKAGHGDDLANMLKRAYRDELCNINPHPFIEALEYDHPGLANRLTAIYRGMGRDDAGEE